MPSRKQVIAFWAVVALVLTAADAQGRGAVDKSFSGDGRVTAGFGPERELGWFGAAKMAATPAGRLVVLTSSMKPRRASDELAIFRFNSKGRRDRSFGHDGRVDLEIPGNIETPVGVVVDEAGRIVVGAENYYSSEVVRLLPDGRLDPSFAGDGIAGPTRALGPNLTGFTAQSDGKLILVGSLWQEGATPENMDFAVTRVTTDGQLDPEFGVDGRATIDFRTPEEAGATSEDAAHAVTVLENGQIVVVGTSSAYEGTAARSTVGVARLNPDGSLDPSFGADGTVLLTTESGGASRDWWAPAGAAVKEWPDGNIAIGGVSNGNIVASALSPDGSPVSSFAGDGTATFDFGGADLADALAVSPEGDVILAGSVRGRTSREFAVLRLLRSGRRDSTFGRGGLVRIGFGGGYDDVDDVVLLPSGKIVVSGTVGDDKIGLARLRP